MVRLVSKRTIKKTPIKRASTFMERIHKKETGELILLLAEYPNTKITPLIRKYLTFVRGISNEEIDRKIQKIREKRKIKEDLSKYYMGIIPASEIEKKYPYKEFIKDPGVHATAKSYNKFKIPIGKNPQGKTIQRLLIDNQPLYKKYIDAYIQIKKYLKNGREDLAIKKEQELNEWLLQLAQDRPEFAANIAHIVLTNKVNRESNKTLRKNSELKKTMENLLTDREMAEFKKNPFMRKIISEDEMKEKRRYSDREKKNQTLFEDEDNMMDKQHIPDDEELSKSKGSGSLHDSTLIKMNKYPIPGSRYLVLNKENPDKVDKVVIIPKYGHDTLKYRKKKVKKKAPTRRKSHKVIKVRKPIKRCRCK